MALKHFNRKTTEGQVTFTSKDDPRRKVLVTKKSIVPIGNFQQAPSDELQETGALFEAAVEDQRALTSATRPGRTERSADSDADKAPTKAK